MKQKRLPGGKISRKVGVAVEDINSPTSHVATMEHAIIIACQEYLMEYGVIPPRTDISESIQYSVEQLNDMLASYQKVVSVLEDVLNMQLKNAHEIEVVMTAKFGIVTNGQGFRLNRQYLRYMIVNGQGEVAISNPCP